MAAATAALADETVVRRPQVSPQYLPVVQANFRNGYARASRHMVGATQLKFAASYLPTSLTWRIAPA